MAINNEINITLTAKDKASKGFKQVDKSAWGLWSRLKKLWWPLKTLWIWLAAAWTAAWVVWVKLFNMADDVETTIWKAQTVFWEYFDDMDKFWNETAKAMWLSRTEFLKTAAWMQDLLVPMWFTRQEAAEMTKETIWLAWALSEWSAWQYTAEEASGILTKAMLWEKEQLKAMWINVDISSEAFKKRIAIIQEDTWKTAEQAKAIDISRQIMEKSTDAQKAYAEWAESLTRKKAEMSATLKNVQETIATALIPAFHKIVQNLQPIIEKVAESIKLWFENKKNVEKLTSTIKTIIWVFGTLFEWIGKIVWFLWKMWEMFWTVAAEIVIFSWKVKDAFISMWNSILDTWESVKSWTLAIFNSIKNTITWIINWITSSFTSAFNKIKWIFDKIVNFKNKIWWAISSAASSVRNTVSWSNANWWPVTWWKSFLVWEWWPEIFTPWTSWNITPNGSIWWTVNINMWGVSVNNEADEDRLVDKIKNVIYQESYIAKLS